MLVTVSQESAKAAIINMIQLAAKCIRPSERRELLCAIHQHITDCIANIDEITRLAKIGMRLPASHLAWGGSIDKEGSD